MTEKCKQLSAHWSYVKGQWMELKGQTLSIMFTVKRCRESSFNWTHHPQWSKKKKKEKWFTGRLSVMCGVHWVTLELFTWLQYKEKWGTSVRPRNKKKAFRSIEEDLQEFLLQPGVAWSSMQKSWIQCNTSLTYPHRTHSAPNGLLWGRWERNLPVFSGVALILWRVV